MLKIRNLEAGYGSLKVLRKLSMHVSPGEIVTISPDDTCMESFRRTLRLP